MVNSWFLGSSSSSCGFRKVSSGCAFNKEVDEQLKSACCRLAFENLVVCTSLTVLLQWSVRASHLCHECHFPHDRHRHLGHDLQTESFHVLHANHTVNLRKINFQVIQTYNVHFNVKPSFSIAIGNEISKVNLKFFTFKLFLQRQHTRGHHIHRFDVLTH